MRVTRPLRAIGGKEREERAQERQLQEEQVEILQSQVRAGPPRLVVQGV
jgi:hypothetical protein